MQAGQPSDDPTVAALRSRFKDARALVGSKNWGTLTFGEEHLRVGPQGELLVEFGLTRCSFEECLFHVVRDGCDDDWREALVGYSECRVTP